jgi:glycosyltransferase involved in cell wall biosynthesis
MDLTAVRLTFSGLRCCVIIPTFNNGGTLERIIRGVLQYTDDIIVVNDGSTDSTPEILEKFRNLEIISCPVNAGKGSALRKGFERAIQKGYSYAITIDSDGQHFPEDIPAFIEAIEKEPDSLVLGARNMDQEGVPGTSSFGHKFSIFWFRIETGMKVPDVQTGFRLYPLERIKDIRLYSTRFELEVEALVRLAWRGVKIISVPVKVYYAPKGERVSHFRKFTDFARVSLVNSILVMMAILWIRPFLFAKGLKKKSVRGFIKEYIVDSRDSNAKLAWSVALGVFVGTSPLWGWQMVIAISTAHALKLNKFVTVAASNISIPPVMPLILFMSYVTGGWILGYGISHIHFTPGLTTLLWVKQNLVQYILGSLVFGLILGSVLGLITWLLLKIFRKVRPDKDTEIPLQPGP